MSVHTRLVRGYYVVSTVQEDGAFDQIVLSPEEAKKLRDDLGGAV